MIGARIVVLVLMATLASSYSRAAPSRGVMSVSELLYSDTRGLEPPIRVRADISWVGHGFLLIQPGCDSPCEHLVGMDVSRTAMQSPRVSAFVSSIYATPPAADGRRLHGVVVSVRPIYTPAPRPVGPGRLRYVGSVALEDVEPAPPR